MGTLSIRATKSIARASVASEVARPRMISTSFMRSTGEKKCRPIKFAGRTLASARPVMGRVEVLEAKTAFASSAASALRVASAFTARSSNTASTTSSQPERRVWSAVGAMRDLASARAASDMRSRARALPRAAVSISRSSSTASIPARAAAPAIPAPIMPAPRIPTRENAARGAAGGRFARRRAAPAATNRVRSMFRATAPVATCANQRASTLRPASMPSSVPS